MVLFSMSKISQNVTNVNFICVFNESFKFFYNSLFSSKSWQNPVSDDCIVKPIEYQCGQDSARIWQKMTN